MSTDCTTDSEVGPLDPPHRQHAELTGDLERTRLQVAVALDITPLISQTVYEHDDRVAVVADIADCWQRLSPAVRDTYRACPTGSAPGRFGGDYIDLVEQGAFADLGDATPLSKEQEEDLTTLRWQAHLTNIRRRSILRQPPPNAWLEQFPPATEPAP